MAAQPGGQKSLRGAGGLVAVVNQRPLPACTPARSAPLFGVLILLAVIVKLTGLGGDHGPGRHMGANGTPPTRVIEIQNLPGNLDDLASAGVSY